MDDRTWAARLALAAGHGDQVAAAALIRTTQEQVWRFVAHLVGPDEADGLTRETYLRAVRRPPAFTADSSVHTWLLMTARRVVADQHRTATAGPPPARRDERQADTEDTVALRRLLDRLAPERREAFVVTQVLGLSYAEAAQILDCAVDTVRSRVARARDDLVSATADADASRSGRRSG
ncbi:sigma-70 family RNA polymerase sigma factor [Micromonospora sp. WMMD812]|uniref:sigma-70 family RNA polymerase sigma factor n=1 Tax=Micromonospora sp. WMMD812 TaxID=3015152 RepID=UPI00248BAC41|nr:sigma-70 family RNA polymerase sigma factor [Micromonospora sp. WMMD812]WBB67799.1 sigma-70 family RNA polymerase sigma factor [Micromonospora sp. WMMD812]WBB67809.1 sigma-70 family RNA polymerase sigma factor [Micromonospora sp. WMMD812]